MTYERYETRHFGTERSEDAVDLIDAISALERDMAVEPGALIRGLTSMLGRRRRFEEMKRDHDVRIVGRSRGDQPWLV